MHAQFVDSVENGDGVSCLFYHFMGDSEGKTQHVSIKYNQGSRQGTTCFGHILLAVCGVSLFAEIRCQASSELSAH